jgi:hypothetical protein
MPKQCPILSERSQGSEQNPNDQWPVVQDLYYKRVTTRGQCYKTFYGRELRIFVLS